METLTENDSINYCWKDCRQSRRIMA